MKPMPAPTLIRTTKSICPVCYRIIDAKLYEENGAVYMEKNCAERGTSKDRCWSDYQLYKQFEAKNIEEARETLLFVRMHDSLKGIHNRNLNSAPFWGIYIIQVPHPDIAPSLELQ